MLISLCPGFSRNPCPLKKNPPLPAGAKHCGAKQNGRGKKRKCFFFKGQGSGDFSTKKHEEFGVRCSVCVSKSVTRNDVFPMHSPHFLVEGTVISDTRGTHKHDTTQHTNSDRHTHVFCGLCGLSSPVVLVFRARVVFAGGKPPGSTPIQRAIRIPREPEMSNPTDAIRGE